jgi:hypothetical protein
MPDIARGVIAHIGVGAVVWVVGFVELENRVISVFKINSKHN